MLLFWKVTGKVVDARVEKRGGSATFKDEIKIQWMEGRLGLKIICSHAKVIFIQREYGSLLI